MAQHLRTLATTGRPLRLPEAIARLGSAFQGGDVKRIARQDLIELGQRSLQNARLSDSASTYSRLFVRTSSSWRLSNSTSSSCTVRIEQGRS